MSPFQSLLLLTWLLVLATTTSAAKKELSELSDADLERIYEQWEVN